MFFFHSLYPSKLHRASQQTVLQNIERLKITGVYVPYFIAKGLLVIMVKPQSFHFTETVELIDLCSTMCICKIYSKCYTKKR